MTIVPEKCGLDIGAGDGSQTQFSGMLEEFDIVHAVEPNPQSAAFLREKIPTAIVHECGLQDLEPEELGLINKFEYIRMVGVITAFRGREKELLKGIHNIYSMLAKTETAKILYRRAPGNLFELPEDANIQGIVITAPTSPAEGLEIDFFEQLVIDLFELFFHNISRVDAPDDALHYVISEPKINVPPLGEIAIAPRVELAIGHKNINDVWPLSHPIFINYTIEEVAAKAEAVIANSDSITSFIGKLFQIVVEDKDITEAEYRVAKGELPYYIRLISIEELVEQKEDIFEFFMQIDSGCDAEKIKSLILSSNIMMGRNEIISPSLKISVKLSKYPEVNGRIMSAVLEATSTAFAIVRTKEPEDGKISIYCTDPYDRKQMSAIIESKLVGHNAVRKLMQDLPDGILPAGRDKADDLQHGFSLV